MHDVKDTQSKKKEKKTLFKDFVYVCGYGHTSAGNYGSQVSDALGQELGVVGSCSRECRESNSGSLQNRT